MINFSGNAVNHIGNLVGRQVILSSDQEGQKNKIKLQNHALSPDVVYSVVAEDSGVDVLTLEKSGLVEVETPEGKTWLDIEGLDVVETSANQE